MDRVSFLIASNNIKNTLTNDLEYWDAYENNAPSFQNEIRWNLNDDVLRFYCIKISTTTLIGKTGTYDVFQIIPKLTHRKDGTVDRDYTMGTKLFRLFARLSLDTNLKDQLCGPWMPKDFETEQLEASSILKEQVPEIDSETGEVIWKPKEGAALRFPITVAGIDSEEMAAVIYKPSVEDVIADKEIPIKDILPKLAPVEIEEVPEKIIEKIIL